MRTNRTQNRRLGLAVLIVLSLTAAAVVSADWTNLETDGTKNGHQSEPESKVLVDHIFSDGFESGDTSAWSRTIPDEPVPCPAPTLTLPVPTGR